jgi:hypothetical protein
MRKRVWRSLKRILILPSAMAIAFSNSGALAQSFTGLSGVATLVRRGQVSQVYSGSRLYEGDVLSVAGEYRFLLDFGAGVVTARRGKVEIILLRRESGCLRNAIGYTGKLFVVPRPFNCPRSLLQIQSLVTGAAYTFRGTAAELEDRSSSSILKVAAGKVAVESVGQTQEIEAGYGNITVEGQPPGPPIALTIPGISPRIKRGINGVWIVGKANPLNTVRIQGTEIPSMLDAYQYYLRYPVLGNSVLVEQDGRVYSLPLPTRR